MSPHRAGPLTPTFAEQGFAWFHRVVAVYCLLFGLIYWIRLVGVYPGDLWRFDLMPAHWQVVCVMLAALFPFAAIGLWMLASWGAVIWFICAVTEIYMYWWNAGVYGARPMVVATHVVLLAMYAGFYWKIRRDNAVQ